MDISPIPGGIGKRIRFFKSALQSTLEAKRLDASARYRASHTLRAGDEKGLMRWKGRMLSSQALVFSTSPTLSALAAKRCMISTRPTDPSIINEA